MTPTEAYIARLTKRAAQMSPELARAQLRAYEMIREVLTEAELARAIRSGEMDALIDGILNDKTDGPFLRLKAKLDQATINATVAESRFLPSRFQAVVFDTLSPHVVEAVQRLDTRVIDTLRAEVRESVRTQVRLGIEAGKGPRVIARELRPLIGLAPNQAKAVANFRRQLETGDRLALDRVLGRGVVTLPEGGTIHRRGHANGQGLSARDMGILDRKLGDEALTPEQIDRMTAAYSKRMLAWNAETHARTMALDANKLAQQLSWEDAVARGVVNATDLEETWTAVGGANGDGRNREEHLAMHGETIPFGGVFSNGERIPGESTYNCRCLKRTTIKRMAVAA